MLLAWFGPGATFLATALPLARAVAAFAGMRPPPRPGVARAHLFREVLDGLRLPAGTPAVRLPPGMMIVVTILGFSFASMPPAVAGRILEVGPEGLGVLTAGVAVGAAPGAALLVFTSDRLPHGLLPAGVFETFGLLVVVLGNSTIFS